MTRNLVSAVIRSRQASLLSLALALTLGMAAGCGTTPDEPSAPGRPEVGSVKQGFDQIFSESLALEGFGTAESCQTLANADYRAQLLADTDEAIDLKCSLTLQRLGTQGAYETIKRPLRFRKGSSGVILDCQDHLRPGGYPASISHQGQDLEMIGIRSVYPYPFQVGPDEMYVVDYRPQNIIVRNCSIEGHVRIAGLQGAGQHSIIASHDTDDLAQDRDVAGNPLYVERARALAPTNIVFHKVYLHGMGSTPLYINQGVTRFTMIDSFTQGTSKKTPGVYLDAESSENTFLNSTLRVKSSNYGREQIAVDTSSYNFMVGNRVSGLDDGGFNLYRNCGEHGAIRYSTPSYNVIFGNQFVYKDYHLSQLSRDRYATHLSSRNGPYTWSNNYCDSDLFIPGSDPVLNEFGVWVYPIHFKFPKNIDTTFLTNDDLAHDNIVTGNEFLRRMPSAYVKSSSQLFNFTTENRRVLEFSSGKKACFSPHSFGRVLLHGNSEVTWLPVLAGTGESGCARYSCDDGDLGVEEGVECPESDAPISFECRATNDYDGCSNVLSCPLGQRVTNVRAACNLEEGTVSDADLASVPWGNVKVFRPSQRSSEGACHVLSAKASIGTQPITVQQMYSVKESGNWVPVPHRNGVRTVSIGCTELDVAPDGGDCHVKAEFTCQ